MCSLFSAMDVDKMVHALVTDPCQTGWRGNTTAWMKRAKWLLDDANEHHSASNRHRIAACILDVRLLRPDLVKHCPAHRPTVWDPLYADVCHVVVTLKSVALPMVAWLGALAYFIHHHPQMGAKRMSTIVSPGPEALELSFDNRIWGDLSSDRLCTQTVMILAGATLIQFGPSNAVSSAVAWLQARPISHFSDRIINALPSSMGTALDHKRHHHVMPNNNDICVSSVTNGGELQKIDSRNDVLGYRSLRMFGLEDGDDPN
jgi:hypothetical protein